MRDLWWLMRAEEFEQRVWAGLLDFEVFAGLHARARAYEAEDWVWEDEQAAAGIAEALAAVGALSAAQARAWCDRVVRELWETLEHTSVPLADAASHEASAAHLRGLLEAVAGDEEQEGSVPSRELVFERSLEALEAVGAIDAAQGRAWRERLAARVGRSANRECRRAGERVCSAVELTGVLAGSREGQESLSVTSVELYTDGVVVRWHLSVELSPEDCTLAWRNRQRRLADLRRELTPRFALSDDVGTAYEAVSSGWPIGIGLTHHPDKETIDWQSVFWPAVPERATRLELIDGNRRHFVIPLGVDTSGRP